jgi:AraC-like DNA-binding protein
VVAQPDAVRVWREEYARRHLQLDFEPLPNAPLRVSVEPVFEDLRVVRTALSPGLTFRDEGLVKDSDDAFGLPISQCGNLEITQQSRDVRLGPGDATLLNVCATATLGSRRNFRWIGVLIPRPELEARGARPGHAVMRRVPRQSEVLQLLRGYLRSLERSRFGGSAQSRATVREHLIDLVALAITLDGAVGESGLSAVVAARLAAAIDHIAACFQDPELSVAAVAQSQGISPRYLQRLLETSGTSFTARVTELRLQRAFAILSEPGTRRISDIALEAGFSDISHFNRLFRARFGNTPSAIRAQGVNKAFGRDRAA